MFTENMKKGRARSLLHNRAHPYLINRCGGGRKFSDKHIVFGILPIRRIEQTRLYRIYV